MEICDEGLRSHGVGLSLSRPELIQPPQSLFSNHLVPALPTTEDFLDAPLAKRPGRELHCHLRPAPWARGRRAQARERLWLAKTDLEGQGRGRRGGGGGRRSALLQLDCHVPPGEGRLPAALHCLRPPDPPKGLHRVQSDGSGEVGPSGDFALLTRGGGPCFTLRQDAAASSHVRRQIWISPLRGGAGRALVYFFSHQGAGP